MSIEKLYEIDRRALLLGKTLTKLAAEAGVSHSTMRKFKVEPDHVRPRTVSKLIVQLEKWEAARGN